MNNIDDRSVSSNGKTDDLSLKLWRIVIVYTIPTMKIIVTNDDGYDSVLVKELFYYCQNNMKEYESFLVVPSADNSGVSQAINVSGKICYTKHSENQYTVDGTPTDCVNVACNILGNVDVVLSGPNIGSNLGRDIMYSGTVAAAREAAVRGIPSVAFSMVDDSEHPLESFDKASFASFLDTWLKPLIAFISKRKNKFVNVNIADCASKQLHESGLSMRYYFDYHSVTKDEQHENVYCALQRLGVDESRVVEGTDWGLTLEGKNVYTVLNVWPKIEEGTELELQSYL